MALFSQTTTQFIGGSTSCTGGYPNGSVSVWFFLYIIHTYFYSAHTVSGPKYGACQPEGSPISRRLLQVEPFPLALIGVLVCPFPEIVDTETRLVNNE
jgi:hypothetical protein